MKVQLVFLVFYFLIIAGVSSQTPPATRCLHRVAGDKPLSVKQVQPLLTTKWGQGCLYNENCPAEPLATTTCLHTPAGSGAIAIAQIMKFYGYPAHGFGEHGYTNPFYGIQYANFGATNYNWSLMPDSLTANNIAVSTLIYQCAVAQEVDFKLPESVSTPNQADSGLVKYFGYPDSSNWQSDSSFTASEWKGKIKTELNAGHPVILWGTNFNNAKQRFFICDGYLDNETFHINWGETGIGNGWYSIDNLVFDTINYSFNLRALFDLAPSPPPPASVIMDFESVSDFSLTFGNWLVKDGDKHDTYPIPNITFPHQTEPMAFLCFNPAHTTPSMGGDASIQPHGGQRFGACFSSNPPSNNDWFISPQVQLGVNGSFSFWIKSYSSGWGLDSYQVAVSVTDTAMSSFTIISGAQPLLTTTEWTRKVFNLSAYNNQKVYIAIRCVSNDNFLMMIDDLEIKPEASTLLSADFTASVTSLRPGESVNFTDQSSGAPVSWTWSFPGGNPSSSTDQNPSGIHYNANGVYSVKLLISNGITNDSLTKTGYIKVSGFPPSATLDFESLADFTADFSSWTLVDVGGGTTYGIQGASFPGDFGPMAYICFNPSKTTPPLTNMTPHTGLKLGCCFSSVPPYNPNNKWLISPHLTIGANGHLQFWVMTYNNTWGYEQFRALISTGSNLISDFTPLHVTPETAPGSWTLKTYSLAAYENQDVYLAIQCVTDNGFIFMVDDISVTSALGTDEIRKDHVKIYPNPAKDKLQIALPPPAKGKITVNLINLTGEIIKSADVSPDSENFTFDLSGIPGGLYLIKIQYADNVSIQKISINP